MENILDEFIDEPGEWSKPYITFWFVVNVLNLTYRLKPFWQPIHDSIMPLWTHYGLF